MYFKEEEYRLKQGFVELISIYAKGDRSCKQAIIRYLKAHIRQSRERSSVSPLKSICEAWTQDRRPSIESIILELLPVDRITWVPNIYANEGDNPLISILKVAETNASALSTTRIIINYCVSHAIHSRNLAFLSLFFGALHECMEIFSDEVFEQLGRVAYVPVMHRSYVLSHSTIARPPKFRLQFWKPNEELLYKMNDPILRLDATVKSSDPNNDKFTRPIFVASFDALWCYKDKELKELDSNPLPDTATVHTTTWWKTLYHMIRLKCRLWIHNYVEPHDFTIEFYDNPAIAALVAYKWQVCASTIGFWYWSVRFFSQFCFYASVTIAAIMQVYYPQPSQLFGLFVAIIAMAAIFIWLELLQAVRSFRRYTKSGYNVLDMLAFSLPMVASINQIVVIKPRIIESVCKYVTIIQEAVYEIRVFFVIFAGALINVAFNKGDDGWRLVWIESRLRYIESAENMSYHIPGFRQTHNYFPKEIYFSATPKQVHAYREKYHIKDNATKGLKVTEEWLVGPSAADDDKVDEDYLFEGEEVDDGVAGEGLNSEGTATLSKAAEQDGAMGDVTKDPSSLQQQLSSEEQATIRELNSQVGELKSQVLLLQTQMSDQANTQQGEFIKLQNQFAAQLIAAQKDQFAAQKDQFSIQQEQVQKQLEELKNLLVMRSSIT
ncbi:hypothetical protein BGZ58_009079 [Dissophora ornata]|nr:hypothetical protein BGZ58_009079 [Dissophora ornata]